MNKLSPIHIWVPGIREGSGGIQAFCRTMLQAVRESFPERPLHVLVKNDDPLPDDPLRGQEIQFTSVASFAPAVRTAMMATRGIAMGLREKPACVLAGHLHFLPAVRILRMLTRIPYCGFLYGIEAWNLTLRHRIRAMLVADRLIAISRFTRDKVVQEYGMRQELINLVPCTFDVDRFGIGPKPPNLLAKHGLRVHQPVLLTVGRLALSERYKGHRQVLYALPQIRKLLPDIRYVIAGDGADLPRLQEAVEFLNLKKEVIFAGQVPGAELPDYYRLCDAFVMPSTKEGFGIVYLEAMATGKPVIAGNLDGSVDALDDGRLGVLVDPCSPSEISNAISDVLLHRKSHDLIFDPERLRDAVAKTFGYDHFKRSLREILEPMLKNEKGTATVEARTRPAPPAPVKASPMVPRITVVTQLTSPYQVELFNAVATQGRCRLDVIYLTTRDRSRQWSRPLIAHSYIVLDQDHASHEALATLIDADVVIFNNYVSVFSLRALASRARTGRPWVFWGERPGFLRLGVVGRWFRRIALRVLHQSRAPIWGIGKFGIEGYQTEFGDQHAYWNIPYFSELNRFRTPPHARLTSRERVFLLSSALSRRKGADIVARAFAKVAAKRSDVHLFIMGEGAMEPRMRGVLAGVADRVTWVGFQGWNDLPEFFHKSDILCAPSRHDGWGLAVVEGLAAGLPVISTDRTGAALDFVRHGCNGWICPIGDVDAVAAAMHAAADLSPNQLALMSAAASASVAEQTLERGAALFQRASLDAIESWSCGGGQGRFPRR